MAGKGQEAIDIGTKRQLFFDDMLIESSKGEKLGPSTIDVRLAVSLDGYSQTDAAVLCGNSVKMPVTWDENQDVSELSGYPIRLRFTMRDCKLYSFAFAE